MTRINLETLSSIIDVNDVLAGNDVLDLTQDIGVDVRPRGRRKLAPTSRPDNDVDLNDIVRQHAMAHYDAGWDVVVETMTDSELTDAIGNAKTAEKAIARIDRDVVAPYRESRANAASGETITTDDVATDPDATHGAVDTEPVHTAFIVPDLSPNIDPIAAMLAFNDNPANGVDPALAAIIRAALTSAQTTITPDIMAVVADIIDPDVSPMCNETPTSTMAPVAVRGNAELSWMRAGSVIRTSPVTSTHRTPRTGQQQPARTRTVVSQTDRRLPDGTILAARYKGNSYTLRVTVTESGRVYRLATGETFTTPSGAGLFVTRRASNGWAMFNEATLPAGYDPDVTDVDAYRDA